MSRLIDADDPKLRGKLKFIREAERQIYGRGSWCFSAKCEAAIDDAQTVDAVPVQRCDGCRYADWHSNGCIAYCTKHGTDGHVADGFCSEGEKDGDGNG